MNNLYRDLAPITEEAWEEIELEARRTFKRHIAGRRVVDVSESAGPAAAAVSTGRLLDVKPPSDGVISHLRASKPLVRLRVPFTLSRSEIDNVERGSQDSDWDPVKSRGQEAGVRRRPCHLRGLQRRLDRRHPQLQLQPGVDAAQGH